MSIQENVQSEPRNQYVDFWNEVLVPKFVRWKHIIVDGLTLHSEAIFPTLRVGPGDKVVDVGCGFGDTAIKLAKIVGPSGSVLAIDCCDGFLEFGRQDAKAAGISNITFLEEDVQTYPFEPIHDFCFSRFGTQFFENPVAGMRNMRKSLKPGGIMTMIVWRGIKDNPWLGSAKDVVLRFLPPPGENAQTCGPRPLLHGRYRRGDQAARNRRLPGHSVREDRRPGFCRKGHRRCRRLPARAWASGRGLP